MLDRLFFRLFPRLKIPRLIGLPKTMMTPNKLGRVYPRPFFLCVGRNFGIGGAVPQFAVIRPEMVTDGRFLSRISRAYSQLSDA
ncbi:MAG: hypothetical protein CMO05_03350 [Thalassospira sp.]|nr:hypothetical protein [Thalassospira sp.]|tara:strand:- start:44546 stop:44797 length:252 start_codon:yes stop_codon:yes gene_type:complete